MQKVNFADVLRYIYTCSLAILQIILKPVLNVDAPKCGRVLEPELQETF